MSRWFTARMKMADLLSTNYNLLMLLPRLGIKLGFGNSSVADVCRKSGMPESFAIMVFNCYTFNDYEPDIDSLSNSDLSYLTPYLVASHKYYVEERLPHIERHLNHIAEQTGTRYADTLRTFFQGYRDEVVAHFAYEEENVFPIMEHRLAGGTGGQDIALFFAKSHDNIVDKLSDLTQIIFKYLPSDGMMEELNELLFAILQLSDDLRKHAMIEDMVIIPYLTRKEAGKK